MHHLYCYETLYREAELSELCSPMPFLDGQEQSQKFEYTTQTEYEIIGNPVF